VEKLERQILKHKGKRMKRKTQAKRPDIEIELSSDQSVAIGDKPKKEIDLVHADLAEFPLLTAEEAAREMSGDGADFKIFSNAETNRLSIVYKRDDGKIGFIEA
jgi:putative sigma-54 modulation protein